MTLIVCPNDVVDQWENNILEIFPDSVVISKKEAFYEKYESKYKYLVLNYDLFSQPYSPNLILNLVKQKIDFVVLDEIHFTKKREESNESQRGHNIEGLMSELGKKNDHVYVLGLSATLVINELEEGKSLLQLITGKIYDDLSTRPTPQNAVKLYEKLSLMSIREIPPYPPPHRTWSLHIKL
jgi:superfamily II DNA or RNA helicase